MSEQPMDTDELIYRVVEDAAPVPVVTSPADVAAAAELTALVDAVVRRQTGQPTINRYTCKCGAATVTRDVEPGVTPAILRCQRCGGDQVSEFYLVDQALEPVAEWFKPTGADLAALPRALRQHVADGGLVLRAIATGRPAIVGEKDRPAARAKRLRSGTATTLEALRNGGDAKGPWDPARVDQARGFLKRAKKSDRRRRMEKATRKRNRRR